MLADKKLMVHLVAGARPNFMKVAPLYHALSNEAWCQPILVHTGQHYDVSMSDAFIRDLGLPVPKHHLGVGGGTHAQQTARVMIAYEGLCLEDPPDWIVVVGDVDSTVACALVAAKLGIPLAHLEAGLRSRDRSMPEEINRIVTDTVADLLWTPSKDADENLLREGVSRDAIDRVGNIMIDSFELVRDRITSARMKDKFGLSDRDYGIVTLHRPTNVDVTSILSAIILELGAVSRDLPLVFPVHPRTRQRLNEAGFLQQLDSQNLILAEPMGYIEFMSLVCDATLVITDSGGLQEETTYLNIPCLTIRDSTERPITIALGTNELVRAGQIKDAVARIRSGLWKSGNRPELWDGQTASRVVKSLRSRVAHREHPCLETTEGVPP
jgi:UDP-N-acetylglucosamine 2-epimerase (non-hydrolysing)